MNGRIEREHAEVISITSGRDGGASLAELRDRRQDARPRMYETWQDVARRLASVVGAWACFYWFVSMAVRGREVAGWEIAGLIAGLVLIGSLARRREV